MNKGIQAGIKPLCSVPQFAGGDDPANDGTTVLLDSSNEGGIKASSFTYFNPVIVCGPRIIAGGQVVMQWDTGGSLYMGAVGSPAGNKNVVDLYNLNGTSRSYLSTDNHFLALGHLGQAAGPGTPVPTLAAGTGAGTSPPAPTLIGPATSVVQGDCMGLVQFGTGTAIPAAPSNLVTVTFNQAFQTIPSVVIFPQNSVTQALGMYCGFVGTTAFVISCTVAPAASQTGSKYAFSYICLGY